VQIRNTRHVCIKAPKFVLDIGDLRWELTGFAQNKITKDWAAADLVVESGHTVRGVRPIAIRDAVWTLKTSHLIFPGGI
jgi:hypothetical protein